MNVMARIPMRLQLRSLLFSLFYTLTVTAAAANNDDAVAAANDTSAADAAAAEAAAASDTWTTEIRYLWIAHGTLMLVAFGVFIPISVASSMLRYLLPGALWYKMHTFLNFASFLMILASFAIAVYIVRTRLVQIAVAAVE